MSDARNRDRGEAPLPDGWLAELNVVADLERSFDALEGRKHFHAETMRGFVRSLQLRADDAWEHFDRAYEQALFAEETIPNLVRQFLLNIHTFDNAVLETPVVETSDKTLPELWIPELPESVLDEYPEVRLVIFMRICSEAKLRLFLGESEKATELFGDLLVTPSQHAAPPDYAACPYLGAAAAEFNLGHEEEARRFLRKASREVLDSTGALIRARDAATLHALFHYFGDGDAAEFWRGFIKQLDCPQATCEAFLARAEVAKTRCEYHGRAVVV